MMKSLSEGYSATVFWLSEKNKNKNHVLCKENLWLLFQNIMDLRKMFVFLIWYDLEKYFFNISFSYCALHTRDMSMKYLLMIFI